MGIRGARTITQNLSFLKKKPTWLVFSVFAAGLLYLFQKNKEMNILNRD
jgi:hypothetical protein